MYKKSQLNLRAVFTQKLSRRTKKIARSTRFHFVKMKRQLDEGATPSTKRVRFGQAEVSEIPKRKRRGDEDDEDDEHDVLGRRSVKQTPSQLLGLDANEPTASVASASADDKKHTLDSDEEDEPQKINPSKLDIKSVCYHYFKI